MGKECQLPPSPDNNDQLKGSFSDSVSHWLLLLSAGPQAPAFPGEFRSSGSNSFLLRIAPPLGVPPVHACAPFTDQRNRPRHASCTQGGYYEHSSSPLPHDLPWDVIIAITERPEAPTLMYMLLDLVTEQMFLSQKSFQVSGHKSPFGQRLIGRSWAQRRLAPPL